MAHTSQDPVAAAIRVVAILAVVLVPLRTSEVCAQNNRPELADGPPAVQPLLRIDGERILIPVPGQADLVQELAGIAEPFCEVEAARTITEKSSSSSPRCTPLPADSAVSGYQSGAMPAASTRSDSGTRLEQIPLTAVFAGPAHFSMDTDSCGHIGVQKNPVMIYEGMSVTVFGDGRYEVRAMLDAPRIPAILRLQLTFAAESGDFTTVTLPPISLKPGTADRSSADLANETQTWFVRRTGYSRMLQNLPIRIDAVQVRRSGTVQVGQIPAL